MEAMLTISQLAAYAGVTVRAVRHYHAKGLLPEPGARPLRLPALRRCGRRRAHPDPDPRRRRRAAVAGAASCWRPTTPSSRRRSRRSTAGCGPRSASGSGTGSGSPSSPPATAWRSRPRRSPTSTGSARVGVPESMVEAERDAWILVAAQLPDRMPFYMEMKDQQLDDPRGPRALPRPRRGDRVGPPTTRGWTTSPTAWPPSSRPGARRGVGRRRRCRTTSPRLLDAVFLDSVPGARGSCAGSRSAAGPAGRTSVRSRTPRIRRLRAPALTPSISDDDAGSGGRLGEAGRRSRRATWT